MNGQLEDQVRRVYSYFVFRARPPEEAERLTRLTFQRTRQEAPSSDDDLRDPDQRLFATARAVIAKNPRRRGASKVEAPVPGGPADPEAPPGISTELTMAIGRLHPRERDALALRFGGDLEIDQIAELLDRTPVDVKQRLARGIRGLAELGVVPDDPDATGSPEGSGAGGSEEGKGQKRQPREER